MRASLHFTIAVCLFARPVLCQPQREISPVSPKAQSLFEALRQGEASKVRNAIEDGMDVNIRDADGNTLLIYAAVYAKKSDLEFLLAHGADVNAANKAGHTALMRAMPDPAKVKLLVKHGADVNASAGGTTPLLIAAGIRSAEGRADPGEPDRKRHRAHQRRCRGAGRDGRRSGLCRGD